MMRFFIFFSFLLLICKGHAQTISCSGLITTNTYWNADTVKITGDIYIIDHVNLSIEPGTYIEFQGYFGITALGKLEALGNLADSIIFTVKDTTGFSNDTSSSGKWYGIFIASNTLPVTDTSVLKYCSFKFCRNTPIHTFGPIEVHNSFFYKHGTALMLEGSTYSEIKNNNFCNNSIAIHTLNSYNVNISNNNISYNNKGVISTNTSLKIQNNIIKNNFHGIEAYQCYQTNFEQNNISMNSLAVFIWGTPGNSFDVIDNDISFNRSDSLVTGSGIFLWEASPNVSNNTISYNWSMGGSGIFLNGNSSPSIYNNNISNNYSVGNSGCGVTDDGAAILCVNSSPRIVSNIMANNEVNNSGGAMAFIDSCDAFVVNNTIVNNLAHVSGGGVALCLRNSKMLFKNNIIIGNVASWDSELYHEDGSSPLMIQYCNIDDTVHIGTADSVYFTNTVMTDPFFINASPGAGIAFNGVSADWSLHAYSPCINQGIPDTSQLNLPLFDFLGNPRVQLGRIDIGAIESANFITTNIDLNNSYLDFSVSPNPFNTDFNLKFTEKINGSITLIDGTGKPIFYKDLKETYALFNENINLSNFADGLYILQIMDSKGVIYSTRLYKIN